MTTIEFDSRLTRDPAVAIAVLAWLWPEPLSSRRRRAWALWWLSSVAAFWPKPLQREVQGNRPAGLGGGILLLALDRLLSRWWRQSWLWAWMWPGRLMGPDGEICPLVPWHPALQAQVCDVVPLRRRMARRGMLAGMMMSAAALAAPTLMEGNGALDGGRLSAFLGGGTGETGSGGEGGQGGGSGGGTSGAGPGQTGPGPFNPANVTPPETQNFGPNPGQLPPTDGGAVSGDGAVSGGEGGLTFLDPQTGGGAGGGDGFGLGFGGGSGGGGVGGGGAGGSGVGVGGGVGDGGDSGPGGGGLPTGPGEGTPGPVGDDPLGPPDAPHDPFEMPKDGPPRPADPPGGPGNPFGGGGPLFEEPPGGEGGPLGGPLAPVPEPQTWAMMILGFGAIGYLIRQRRVRVLAEA